MAAVGAYKILERALSNFSGVDTEQAGDAINRTAIETAVDERGITAIADRGASGLRSTRRNSTGRSISTNSGTE